MSPAVDRFVKFLVMECEDEGSTTFVQSILDAAKAKILAGQGQVQTLNSASANGKSFTNQQQLTCDEIAYACRQALRLYADTAGTSPITFADFSGMNL